MGSAITVSMSPLPVYVPPASLTSSILRTVADVVLGRGVVPPVYLSKPGTVKVHRDGWLFGGVTHPVNAPLIRHHGRDPIFPSPLKPPELLHDDVHLQTTSKLAIIMSSCSRL